MVEYNNQAVPATQSRCRFPGPASEQGRIIIRARVISLMKQRRLFQRFRSPINRGHATVAVRYCARQACLADIWTPERPAAPQHIDDKAASASALYNRSNLMISSSFKMSANMTRVDHN